MACIKPGSNLDKDRLRWQAHLVAQGTPAPAAAAQAQTMAVNSARHSILVRKRNIALQASAQRAATGLVTRAGSNPIDAMWAIVERLRNGKLNDFVPIESAQKAVAAVAKSYAADWERALAMAEDMPAAARSAFGQAIRRELAGVPSGNADAARAAVSFTNAAQYLKAESNRLGMDIRTLPDWLYPQRWDGELVAPGGDSSAWVAKMEAAYNTPGAMKPLVDDNGVPLGGQKLHDTLVGIADNIRSGNVHGTIGVLPGALKSRHRQPRVIGFLDNDLRGRMEDEFGAGDIFTNGAAHIETLSREAGTMRVLGPNADVNWGKAREAAARAGASEAELHKADSAYQQVTGALSRPAVPGMAAKGQAFRGGLSAALLTASLPSQFSDLVPRSLVAAANGVPVVRSVMDFLTSLPKKLTPDDVARLSRIGTDAETAIARLSDDGAFDMAERVREVNNGVMKWSGVRKWNRQGAISTQNDLLRNIADNRALDYAAADEAMGGKLSQYGYTVDEWDTIRAHSVSRETDGFEYASVLNLENAATLTPAQRMAASQRLIHHTFSETALAMTLPSPSTRAGLAGRAQAGTPMGELARTLTQFKGFPTQFVVNNIGELLRKQGADRAAHAAILVAGSMSLGMLALQTKRLLKGQGLAEMDPYTEEGRHAWIGALLQGGGLGIVGDFASAGLGGQNRFGQDLVTTLTGPGVGFAQDLVKTTLGNVGEAARGERANAASEAIRFASRYTPGLHLPVLGIASERLIVDKLRLLTDRTGTQRSFVTTEKKQRDEFNSKYWWRPGRTLPTALE